MSDETPGSAEEPLTNPPAKKAPAAKKAVAKKAPTAKKAVAKKAPTAKKAVAKKAPVKKSVAKKAPPTKLDAEPTDTTSALTTAETVAPVKRFGRFRTPEAEAAERTERPTRSLPSVSLPTAGRKTAAVLVVAALVVAGLWFVDWRQDRADAQRSEAASTAVASMKRLLSLKPSTVKDEAAAESELLTGSFAATYERDVLPQFDAVVERKVTIVADIPRAGVISSSGDEVVVLLFANTTRTSPDTETRISGSRMRVTMEKVGDEWKIGDYKSL